MQPFARLLVLRISRFLEVQHDGWEDGLLLVGERKMMRKNLEGGGQGDGRRTLTTIPISLEKGISWTGIGGM